MEQIASPSPAGLGRRSAAALIDLVVFFGLGTIAMIPLTFTSGLDRYLASSDCSASFDPVASGRFEMAVTAVVLGVLAAYAGACWMFGHGQTVGKRILGVRVVRTG